MIDSDYYQGNKNKEDILDQDDVIKETVESNDSDSDANQQALKKKKKNPKNDSSLSPQIISSIQWYVRNKLFQKIKILNENHLESNGKIMEEVLKIAQIDPRTTSNLNAYLIECRQIVKRALCSRRGYVKREIGQQLNGKNGIANTS